MNVRLRPLGYLALLVLVAVAAEPAAARVSRPRIAAIAHVLETHPVYLANGAGLTPKARRALRASARRHDVRIVVLRRLPRGARSLAGTARRLAARLDGRTVAVSLRDGGIATAPRENATVAYARTRVGDRHGPAALLAFARAMPLAAAKPGAIEQIVRVGSRAVLPFWAWLLAAAGLVAAAIALLALRSRLGTRRMPETVADGMELLRRRAAQLSKAVQFEGESASERSDAAAQKALDRAGEIATDVRATLLRTLGAPQQRKAHARLDEAEWHLECARCELDGVSLPPRPGPGQPALCFFDGDHGLGTIEVDLDLQGKAFPVCVCIADALRLGRYEEPQVGFVRVGGETLPWPSAPTWFGSRGFPQADLRELYHGGQPLFREIKPEVHGHGLELGLEPAPPARGIIADSG